MSIPLTPGVSPSLQVSFNLGFGLDVGQKMRDHEQGLWLGSYLFVSEVGTFGCKGTPSGRGGGGVSVRV